MEIARWVFVGVPLAAILIAGVVLMLVRRRRADPRGFDVAPRETPTEPDRHFK